jgi:hypothetical protein
MTPTDREALKLAREALEMIYAETADYITRNTLGGMNNQCMCFAREALAAADAALAEPVETVPFDDVLRQAIDTGPARLKYALMNNRPLTVQQRSALWTMVNETSAAAQPTAPPSPTREWCMKMAAHEAEVGGHVDAGPALASADGMPSPADGELPKFCIFCDKPGHSTDACWSTHGLNTLQDVELQRLVDAARAATPPTAPVVAPAEPAGFMVFAEHNCGWVPLPGYCNETEHGVKSLVLEAARKEGYQGTVAGRMFDLGWIVKPVYEAPPIAAADETSKAPAVASDALPPLPEPHETSELWGQNLDLYTSTQMRAFARAALAQQAPAAELKKAAEQAPAAVPVAPVGLLNEFERRRLGAEQVSAALRLAGAEEQAKVADAIVQLWAEAFALATSPTPPTAQQETPE